MAKDRTDQNEGLFGLMAEFPDVPSIYEAAQRVRDAGFTKWDVYAPVPIHGMDEAMGLPPSKLNMKFIGPAAILGCTAAFLMQWWMSAVDYKIVTAGKPLLGWEQWTPIAFEVTVLFSAFAAISGMLILNKLPMHYHPLLKKERFLRVSDDRYVIAIEAGDPQFDLAETRSMLESVGGINIDVVEA